MSPVRRRGWLVVIVLAAVAIGGCATLPPAQPVADVAAIAGKWRGNIDFGRGIQLFYLTINPDGSIVAEYGINTKYGKVTVAGGKATFELYVWSGTINYLAGNGKRMLILSETFDTFYAQVTPLT